MTSLSKTLNDISDANNSIATSAGNTSTNSGTVQVGSTSGNSNSIGTTITTSENSMVTMSNTDLVALFAITIFTSSNFLQGQGGGILYKTIHSLTLSDEESKTLQNYLNFLSQAIQGVNLDSATMSNIMNLLDTHVNNIN